MATTIEEQKRTRGVPGQGLTPYAPGYGALPVAPSNPQQGPSVQTRIPTIATAAAPAPAAAAPAPQSGGAVFGMYPQLADSRFTLHDTGNKLRAGVQATGPGSFQSAGPIASLAPLRLNAATDPRSATFGQTPAVAGAAPAAMQPVPTATSAVPAPVARAAGVPTAPAGIDLGGGVTRINGGSSPLFTNMPNAGIEGNANLMARGVPSAQNQAAMAGIQSRQDIGDRARAAQAQFAKEEADAARPMSVIAGDGPGILSKEYQAERLRTFNDSSITRPTGRAKTAADANATQLATAKMQRDMQLQNNETNNATTLRGQDQRLAGDQLQNQTAQARLGVDKVRLGIEKGTAQLDQAGKAQILAAQTAVTNAKTPAERVQAESVLRSLQGKYERETPNRYTVVPGGQTVDPTTGQPLREPSQVLDNQTGQFVQPQGAAPKQQSNFQPGQVYKDGKGNKAKWDGAKFVPV